MACCWPLSPDDITGAAAAAAAAVRGAFGAAGAAAVVDDQQCCFIQACTTLLLRLQLRNSANAAALAMHCLVAAGLINETGMSHPVVLWQLLEPAPRRGSAGVQCCLVAPATLGRPPVQHSNWVTPSHRLPSASQATVQFPLTSRSVCYHKPDLPLLSVGPDCCCAAASVLNCCEACDTAHSSCSQCNPAHRYFVTAQMNSDSHVKMIKGVLPCCYRRAQTTSRTVLLVN